MYKCSKCHLAVIVLPGQEPIRACNCTKEDGTKATIIVDINSTLEGTSTAGVGTTIRQPKVTLG
jgi:hypothetical protein